MKRIKMMLLSLALFAVVGGALAFKAKFDQTFCTAPTVELGADACLNQFCLTSITSVQIGGEEDFVCTAPYDGENCQSGPNGQPCVASARITEDSPGK